MEPKEVDFEFPRGDTIPVTFDLLNVNEENIDIVEEIYFTVKRSFNQNDYLLQKRLSRGEIECNNGQFGLVIEHKDTGTLPYGTYVYDIQIKIGTFYRTVCRGNITLTNEATSISNE